MVASYSSYRDAEAAVDFLSDQRFPVQRVAIVGRDLQTVEQVTGRMGYGRAAGNGAAQGALLGLLFGWLFGLFDWVDPLMASLTLAIYGLIWGAVVGALLGLLLHALSGGRLGDGLASHPARPSPNRTSPPWPVAPGGSSWRSLRPVARATR